MPRLFFGLEIPPAIKERLLSVQAPIAGAKWQNAGQLHLTLLFLGAVDDDQVPAVCASARVVQQAQFWLAVSGLGCFGQPQSPRNLWAAVAPTEPLGMLHDTLMGRIQAPARPSERRAFRPHITLARFKRQAGSVKALLDQYGNAAFGHFPVDEFCLFESRRGPSGSVYSVLERFPLGAGG
ncbi:RNA 2',3'-cyclic phosphodiesterase [Marinobacter sp.]|uniref:RNA 2',3'-cyclic phosphodiesterase n=1 Tax=Marinobacter sp. TaxID=50741 RepID=UPI0035C76D26